MTFSEIHKFVNLVCEGSDKLYNHCMIDLETVDNVATSAITSIGACMFTSEGITSKFYVVVDHTSALSFGMTESASTISWWSSQSEEARSIFSQDVEKVDLVTALKMFSDWFKSANGIEYWGNGADFDNAIMNLSYRATSMTPPWSYGNSRCFRTIKNGAYMQKREGLYHHALDDAITQAQYMIDNDLVPE